MKKEKKKREGVSGWEKIEIREILSTATSTQILRGTELICSSNYLLFRPIFAKWEMCK